MRDGTGRSSIVSRRGRYVNRRLFLSSSLGVENEDPTDRGDLASSSSRDDAGRDGTVKYRLPKGTIRQSWVILPSFLRLKNEDLADRRGLRIVLFERRCGTGRDGQVSSPEGDDTSIVGCSCLHLSA